MNKILHVPDLVPLNAMCVVHALNQRFLFRMYLCHGFILSSCVQMYVLIMLLSSDGNIFENETLG